MIISKEQEHVLNEINKYFLDLGYEHRVVYGSYVEQMHGLSCVPKDIDVTLIVEGEAPEKRHKTFFLGFCDLPINVEIMEWSSFLKELKSLQPKYFMCIGTDKVQEEIDNNFNSKELHEVRDCISAITSRAFDKGKKKLSIESDYDEALGLKNIYHAFKFPHYAKWRYITPDDEIEIEIDTLVLNEIHRLIYEKYNESTGTNQERCDNLIEIFKPLHNSLMTEFRKLFPKKVN